MWVKNGAMIKRELDLVSLKDIGLGYLQDFTNRGWINLTIFKAELILTLCQEFMANIKHRLVIEKGKERLISWVMGQKLKVSLDTFVEIFELPQVRNPGFELPNVGRPDLATISYELLLDGG